MKVVGMNDICSTDEDTRNTYQLIVTPAAEIYLAPVTKMIAPFGRVPRVELISP